MHPGFAAPRARSLTSIVTAIVAFFRSLTDSSAMAPPALTRLQQKLVAVR
jgi:hypothetical protein